MALQGGTVRRKFGKGIVIAVLVLMLSILTAFGVNSLFSIQTIQVIGADMKASIDEQKIPRNLLFFPSEKFRQEVLSDNLLLSDVKFIKNYPHTLTIIPVPREAYMLLRTKDRLVAVDKEGVILGEGNWSASLPVAEISDISIHTGEKSTDPRIGFLLSFIGGCRNILPVSTITNTDVKQFLVKSYKTNIYITQDKPLSDTLATLQTLITGFRIKGTLPSVVDLRFDKPVIKL